MDRQQVKAIKLLIKLMHDSGVTHLKVDGIELTIPSPKPSIKTQIMTISPQEFKAASQSAYGNHKEALESIGTNSSISTNKMDDKEFEDLLFLHERF